MSTDVQIAIIGIIGTLGGTILGWVLNNFSQKGKLNIYLKKWTDEFKHNEVGCMVKSSSMEQAESYGYNLSLDLYNSSRETKILRDVNIVYLYNKEELFRNVPKDDYTKRVSHPIVSYDDISVINIPAKSAINLNLHGGVWRDKKAETDNLSFLQYANRIVLEYRNERNKIKKRGCGHNPGHLIA